MEVSTFRELVKAIGGVKHVAAMVNVKPTAVYMAIHRGSVPFRWRIPIHQEAKRKKVSVAPDLLGFEAA